MPIWGWICCGLFIAMAFLFGLGAHQGQRNRQRAREFGVEMVGWIVQANSILYEVGNWDAPAQVLVDFDDDPAVPDPATSLLAFRMANLKEGRPRNAAERRVAALVRDEHARFNERDLLPAEFTDGREVYSLHVQIERPLLPNGKLELPFIRCLVIVDDDDAATLMCKYRRSDLQQQRRNRDEWDDD